MTKTKKKIFQKKKIKNTIIKKTYCTDTRLVKYNKKKKTKRNYRLRNIIILCMKIKMFLFFFSGFL